MAKISVENIALLKELQAPNFVLSLNEIKFGQLRTWITKLMIDHRCREVDEIESLFYDDDERRSSDICMMNACVFKVPQIVVFDTPPKGYENKYPWKDGACLLFMGEIANMPGHCVVVDKVGRVHWGFHTDNFREPTEDEL